MVRLSANCFFTCSGAMFRILRRVERTLWHDKKSSFRWSVHLRFLLSQVPNSLKVLTLSKVCPFTVSDGITLLSSWVLNICFVVISISLVFFSFKRRLESLAHSSRKCMLLFISPSQALGFLGLLWSYRVISSAYWKHVLSSLSPLIRIRIRP